MIYLIFTHTHTQKKKKERKRKYSDVYLNTLIKHKNLVYHETWSFFYFYF